MRNPFRYFKTSPEIIRLAVMMYVRFPLSLRQVEDLRHERGVDVSYEPVRWLNNRAENSHQPFRRREPAMAKFRSAKSLQKFGSNHASIHASVHNHFNRERHLRSRQIFKPNRSLALAEWRQFAA